MQTSEKLGNFAWNLDPANKTGTVYSECLMVVMCSIHSTVTATLIVITVIKIVLLNDEGIIPVMLKK